jgi:hypothetical protein
VEISTFQSCDKVSRTSHNLGPFRAALGFASLCFKIVRVGDALINLDAVQGPLRVIDQRVREREHDRLVGIDDR